MMDTSGIVVDGVQVLDAEDGAVAVLHGLLGERFWTTMVVVAFALVTKAAESDARWVE